MCPSLGPSGATRSPQHQSRSPRIPPSIEVTFRLQPGHLLREGPSPASGTGVCEHCFLSQLLGPGAPPELAGPQFPRPRLWRLAFASGGPPLAPPGHSPAAPSSQGAGEPIHLAAASLRAGWLDGRGAGGGKVMQGTGLSVRGTRNPGVATWLSFLQMRLFPELRKSGASERGAAQAPMSHGHRPLCLPTSSLITQTMEANASRCVWLVCPSWCVLSDANQDTHLDKQANDAGRGSPWPAAPSVASADR